MNKTFYSTNKTLNKTVCPNKTPIPNTTLQKKKIDFGIPEPHAMDELKEELNEITKGKPL